MSCRLIRVIAFIAIFAAGIGVGASYMTFAATSSDTYYACVTSKGDIYRVRINAKYSCIGTDKSISWNQKGQPGPVGPTGPQGQQGLQGQPGEAAVARFICPCDFSGEDDLFQEIGDMTNAYLRNADLSGTGFNDVNLTNADLRGTDLSSAQLGGANLTDASMSGADLSDADLNGATLEDAFMVNVKFVGTDLTNAQGIPFNLSGADWDSTICPDGTNSDTNGDDSCEGHFISLP